MFINLNQEIDYFSNADQEKEKIQRNKQLMEDKMARIQENKDILEENYKESEIDYRRKLKNL